MVFRLQQLKAVQNLKQTDRKHGSRTQKLLNLCRRAQQWKNVLFKNEATIFVDSTKLE